MDERSRLPIVDPEFRYQEATNPYWKKIRELGVQYACTHEETERHPGRWREQFRDFEINTPPPQSREHRELHVELGCNAGHVTLEWAARNPDKAFIGVDWKFKPIYRAAEKAKTKNLKNIIFFRAWSERLHYMFAPGEIDFLHLFFPDPWPKKAHLKNRFITPESLRSLAIPVRTGGIFHIKTDHPGYFEWMLEAIDTLNNEGASHASPWKVFEQTRNLHAEHPSPLELEIPEVTLFEKLFIRDGIRIQSIKLQRL